MDNILFRILVLGFSFSVLCHPHQPPFGVQYDGIVSRAANNATQQIFYGRFISTPTPDKLLIQNGAVLVNSSDGKGYIVATAFNVTNPQAAAANLGVDASIPLIQAPDNGFFFPGFIGKR